MGSSSIPSGSFRATKDARVERGRRTVSSSSSVGRTRIPLLAHARIGSCSPASASRPNATPIAANRAYEDYRQNGRDMQGRRLGRRPKPWVAPEVPEGVVSVTDPDTQRMTANHGLAARSAASVASSA